jgi:hypothetical protein
VPMEHAYGLNLHSDSFILLCKSLNATVRKENATWPADILFGGFRFSDEIYK